jgi:hypothetical protein
MVVLHFDLSARTSLNDSEVNDPDANDPGPSMDVYRFTMEKNMM